MISITREQLGRALGLVILLLLAVSLSGGVVGWAVWDVNPANWSPTARSWHAALTAILLVIRWLYGVVEINDEE
jgi:hypothetical protein